MTGDRYADSRLGYSLARPGPGYAFRDSTSEDFRALSSHVSWSKGSSAVMLFAFWMANGEQGAADIEESIRRRMSDAYGLSRDPVSARTTLGGIPCEHLQWTTDDGRLDWLFAARDRMCFGLWVADSDGALPAEKAKLAFSLLD